MPLSQFKMNLNFSGFFFGFGIFAVMSAGIGIAHGNTSPYSRPRIITSTGKVGELILGKKAEAALKRYDPQFVILKPDMFIESAQDLFKKNSRDTTPMGVVGDFNGDTVVDAVVMGKSGSYRVILGLLSDKGKYIAVPIEETPWVEPAKSLFPPPVNPDGSSETVDPESFDGEVGLYQYLGLVKSKFSREKTEARVKRFKTDAIMIEIYQGPTRLLYYKDGRFQEYKGPGDL